MKITVCIGSSCHIKGSRDVVEEFQRQVDKRGLSDRIELSGTFCMGDCKNGVCVKLDGEKFSVNPATAEEFFNSEVMPRVAEV
ncbi:MAG: (2Fe-2S) ferredoxin domain-containing protein [Firmicutes bacterium]|nr:(2Fe-2S) ferredoxin domain-containing protein [Bacillota bacterium]